MRNLTNATIWSAGRRWMWAGSVGLVLSGSMTSASAGLFGGCHDSGCSDVYTPGECAAECADAAGCDDLGCTDDGCCLHGDEPFTLASLVLGDDAPFTFGGWANAGYHNRPTGLFNNHPDRFNLHQLYGYVERVADGSEGLDYGFRADGVYGVDAQDTQAFGEPAPQGHFDTTFDNGIYGFAVPQAYLELAYGDLSVKLGHFYTLIGYETVTAPDNFFYSHSYTFYNSEPFTHTGALATYNASDDTTLYGGYVFGWDTGFDRFTTGNPGDTSRGSAGIFGFSQALSEDLTLTYIGLAGDMGLNGAGYNHSVVFDYQVTDKLNYVLQSDYVDLQQLRSIGINNFLFYTITDTVAVGGRAEWYRSTVGSPVPGQQFESLYVYTAGLNYRPIANLVIRPEVRHQTGSDRIVQSLGGVTEGAIFGVDAVLTF